MPILRKGGHKDLERYYPLMEADFDSEELIGKLQLHRGMMNGKIDFLIMIDEETRIELAYAIVFTRGIYGYMLLKYFAVLPWYRGKGVGIDAMRLINRYYSEKQGIIAEITDFPDDDVNRQRNLKKFFTRFGYEETESDYRISGTDAHLYVKPLKCSENIAPIAHRIIRDIYSGVLTAAGMSRMIDINRIRKDAAD